MFIHCCSISKIIIYNPQLRATLALNICMITKLGTIPQMLTQLEDHAEATSTRGSCCRPSHVSCSLSLLKRQFVPGESIILIIDIENRGLRRTGACILQLKQVGPQWSASLILYLVYLKLDNWSPYTVFPIYSVPHYDERSSE